MAIQELLHCSLRQISPALLIVSSSIWEGMSCTAQFEGCRPLGDNHAQFIYLTLLLAMCRVLKKISRLAQVFEKLFYFLSFSSATCHLLKLFILMSQLAGSAGIIVICFMPSDILSMIWGFLVLILSHLGDTAPKGGMSMLVEQNKIPVK